MCKRQAEIWRNICVINHFVIAIIGGKFSKTSSFLFIPDQQDAIW